MDELQQFHQLKQLEWLFKSVQMEENIAFCTIVPSYNHVKKMKHKFILCHKTFVAIEYSSPFFACGGGGGSLL